MLNEHPPIELEELEENGDKVVKNGDAETNRSLLVDDSIPDNPETWCKYVPRRYLVAIVCALTSLICYADRTNISVAIIPMAEEFHWSETKQGIVLSSFFYGYSVTQIPGGILAGRYGPKKVLGIAIFLWSVCTLLTPVASYLFSLLIACRILIGIAEGANFPCLHTLSGDWFPPSDRTVLVTMISSGQYGGTVVALLVSPWLATALQWQAVFYFFGVVGLLFLYPYIKQVYSSPNTHPSISASEKQYIVNSLLTRESPEIVTDSEDRPVHQDCRSSVPWVKLFTKMPCWAVYIAHFCNNYGYYIVISWLPKYFKSLGVNLENVGFFTVLPYICMITFSNIGAALASMMQKRGLKTGIVRRIMLVVCFSVPSIFFFLLRSVTTSYQGLIYVTLAMTGMSFSQCAFWVNMVDISPKFAGYIMGISNTMASVAGILGNLITGVILDTTGSWDVVFMVMIAMYMFGGVFYLIFASGETVIQ